MNVQQVIEELQKLPQHLPVRGFNTLIHFADESGETEITPCDSEAQEVSNVQWRGHDVVLECGGMCA